MASKKHGKGSKQDPRKKAKSTDPFKEMSELLEKDVGEAEKTPDEDQQPSKPVSQTFLPTERTVVPDDGPVSVKVGDEDSIKQNIIEGCEKMVKELIKRDTLTPGNVNTFWDHGPFEKRYSRFAKVFKVFNLIQEYPDWIEFIEDTIKSATIYWFNKVQEDIELEPPEVIPLPAPKQETSLVPETPIDLREELYKSIEMVTPDPEMRDLMNVSFPPVDMADLPPYIDKETVLLMKQFLMFKVKVQSAYLKKIGMDPSDEYVQTYLVELMMSISPSGADCIEAAKEVGVSNAPTNEIMAAGFCRAMRKKMRTECPDLFEMLNIA